MVNRGRGLLIVLVACNATPTSPIDPTDAPVHDTASAPDSGSSAGSSNIGTAIPIQCSSSGTVTLTGGALGAGKIVNQYSYALVDYSSTTSYSLETCGETTNGSSSNFPTLCPNGFTCTATGDASLPVNPTERCIVSTNFTVFDSKLFIPCAVTQTTFDGAGTITAQTATAWSSVTLTER